MRHAEPSLFAGIVPFVAVADAGNFRLAAQRLGLTPSAVSKAIARLEAELGVRLFARTSRTVRLTAEGELFLGRSREALAQVRAGQALVRDADAQPHGLLRVSLPPALGEARVVPSLPSWLAQHPAVTLELVFTDRFVSLLEENVAVALRVGKLEDSRLVARPLPPLRWKTVASPAYLARYGAPATVEALARHVGLVYLGSDGRPRPWAFRKAGGTVEVLPPSVVSADLGSSLVTLARAGVGIAQAHDYMVAAALANGELQEVLPALTAPAEPVTLLYAPGKSRHPTVRALGQWMTELLA